MAHKTLPQIIVLAIIARNRSGITIRDVVNHIAYLNKHGIDTGYEVSKNGYTAGIPRQLLLDINVLKVMNLVKEENGKLIALDKAYIVLKKYSENNSIIKSILATH